jgi:hypothetical protein
MTGLCEHGNEPSDSIKKAGYFFDKPNDIQLLNNICHHGISIFSSSILTSLAKM